MRLQNQSFLYQSQLSQLSPTPQPTYHGGKVLQHMQIVPIYYGKFWQTAKGRTEKTYYDAFAKKLVKSKYTSVWAQYGVGKGSFGGSDVVPTEKNPRTIREADVQQIVKQELDAGNVSPENGQAVYTVFLPPGTVLVASDGTTSREGLGGYHGSYNDSSGKKVYYAAIVHAEGQNGVDFGEAPRDNVTIIASHEWTEAATDPDVNNGRLGWYDYSYGEVSDIPMTIGLPLDEVYGHLNGYAVQKNWSNEDGQAEIVAKHPKPVESLPDSGAR